MESSASSRKRTRDYSPERPRSRDHSIASNSPFDWAARSQRSSSAGEQSDARAGSHGGRDDVSRHTADSRPNGHDYRNVYTRGYARVQLGDTYVEQQNILPRPHVETAEQKKQRLRNEFMTDLGFNSMESRLATIGPAQAETCSWLFSSPEYLRWRDPAYRDRTHGFVWIKGKPGAGKSTIMKHALQYQQSHNHDNSIILSFFFNARGYDLEKSTEGLYRSLLHQAFTRFPQRIPEQLLCPNASWQTQGWPLPMLQNLLHDSLLGFGNQFSFVCYVDALDECDEDAIRSAVQYLEELGEMAHLRGVEFSVCFASRNYPNISMESCETINLDNKGEHQQDISTFVERKLRGTQSLRTALSEQISGRCLGVFLWAVLVVQMMNKMMDHGLTRSQLLAKLKQVPDGIEELFVNMILNRSTCMLPTLQWVLFSREFLSVDLLYFAVKTGVGQLNAAIQDAAETSEEQMRMFILTSSRGLVEFTHHVQPRVQFIHETVREHLLNSGLVALDPSLFGNVTAISHARLGRWCLDRIKASMNCRHLWTWSAFDAYAVQHMLTHLESAYSGKALGVLCIDAIPQQAWTYMKHCFRCSNETELSPSVYMLIRMECTELAKAVLKRQLDLSKPFSGQGQTTEHRSLRPYPILLVDVNSIHGSDSHDTALLKALSSERATDPAILRVVELLLDCGADPNLAVTPGHTAFHLAMDRERQKPSSGCVKLLLRYGADPNISIVSRYIPRFGLDQGMWKSLDDISISALALAAQWNKEELVELLLKYGAKPGGQSEISPLCLAAGHGTPSMIRLLLAAGAVVGDRDAYGRTALHYTIINQGEGTVQEEIILALRDAGADIDAMDNKGDTAMMRAYSSGKHGLARLLLDRGADPIFPMQRIFPWVS